VSSASDFAALSPRQRALVELRLWQRRRQQSPRPSAEIVAQASGETRFPLSFSQQRLWFVDQLEGGSSFYNVATAVRLTGRLVPDVLCQAFTEVVRRHEALRTTFGARNDEPVQFIGPPGAMELPLVDLRAVAAGDRRRVARHLAAQIARHPFDLARGPLLCLRLLRLDADEHVLVSVMHHIVSDWWSLRVLVRELESIYGAFLRGLPSPLPPLPIQYRDFAVWQRQWLQNEALAEQLSYWRARLAGAPTLLLLPVDHPRPTAQSFHGAQQSFAFPADLGVGLSALARREGCTLFVVFLAAFNVLLNHHSGQEDVVVSAPVSYRNQAESEGLIGFLVNTLLLRGDLSGNPSFRTLLERMHAGVLEDLAHQHLPLDRLIEELAPSRTLSHSPFLQVGINFAEDIASQESRASELAIEAFDFEPGFAQFELNLVLSYTGRSLSGCFQYRTGLFSAARIGELIAEYGEILEAILGDPDVDLAQLRGRLAHRKAAESLPLQTLEGFVLSPQQERLWCLEQEAPGTALRALSTIRVCGPVEIGSLERALRAVVARHEILRTTFRALPGMTVALQEVRGGAPFALRYLESEGSDPQAREEQLDRVCEEMSREPYDLAVGPALKATLLKLSASRHVLAICLPALCADGSTLRHLVAELARALSTGFGDEAPLQYADVAQWQHDLRDSSPTGPARGVAPPVLAAALSFAAAPEAGGSFAPRVVVLAMPRALVERIEALARGQEADAEAVLLAAWQTLLRRLANPADVVTGVGFSGRHEAELQAVLGPLAFYLPLPWSAGGESSFAQRVAATAAVLREAREQPLGQALGRLLPGEPPGAGTFFHFGFDFDQIPDAAPTGAATRSLERWQVYGERFRVRLSCLGKGNGLAAELHFDSAAILREDVLRLGNWYLALLANALDRPACPAEDLAILREDEWRQLLGERGATRVDLGSVATLPELFTAQVRATPQGIALLSVGRRLTYAELDRAAARLAARLVALGAGPEVRIALSVERSIEMVVAILAILRTGAAYVPLDPDFPGERLRFMLEDSRAEVLVTQEHLLPSFAVGAARVLCLDRNAGEVLPEPSLAPGWVSPESLAYVIYTSGSTGRPKGVMISQRAIANRILWMRREFPLGAGDTLLLKTPYGFDASIWEIFVPLVSGARLAIAEPGGHRDPAYLLSAVAEHRVTTLQLVPSQLTMLLESRELGSQGRSLERLFCGGEPLPGESVRRFGASLGAEVCNLYGPTEAAIDATFHLCAPEDLAGVVPIGRPLSNVQAYVLDRRLQPVPDGLAGELVIGGNGLARGYLGQPGLTAERFLPHPFSDLPGERLYRTGDLARRGPGGELEFLGRADGQVKIRGFRIELGEIEAALACHPEIASAVVVARDGSVGGMGERRLVAYYQAVVTKSPAARDLRAFLERSLPEPMVPTVFVELPALPLSPSGKVDRNALPEPGRGAHLPAEFIPPRTAVEQALARIWGSLLGVERVGVNDNFFELGGHSLQGMRLVSHVRDALGVELRVRSIFEHPTLAGLAKVATSEMVRQLGEELVAQLLATAPDPSSVGGGSA
jgi:amino acid adenylation domain-containing protein